DRRRPNATFSVMSSQGSEASSWNTTPMLSGASPSMRRPSNSTLPCVAGVKPAMISSSVDLPQPDGPTTAKNSPRRNSRSIGPSACSAAVVGLAGKVLPTLESATWAVTMRPESHALSQRFQIVREKARIDDLAVIDLAGDGAHRALRFDHALQALQVDFALTPVRHSLGHARGEIAHRASGHCGLDVVLLGDDLRGLVGVLAHENDRLAPRANDGADEVSALLGHLYRGHAHDIVERRQHVAGDDHRTILVFVFRPQGLGDGHDVDLTRVQRSDALAEAARLHQLGILGFVARDLQQHRRERLAGRARIGVPDLLALEVLDALDRRIR